MNYTTVDPQFMTIHSTHSGDHPPTEVNCWLTKHLQPQIPSVHTQVHSTTPNLSSRYWVTLGSQTLLGLKNMWLRGPKRVLCNLPKVLASALHQPLHNKSHTAFLTDCIAIVDSNHFWRHPRAQHLLYSDVLTCPSDTPLIFHHQPYSASILF